MTAFALAPARCGGFGASGFTPGRSDLLRLRRSSPLLAEQIRKRQTGDAAAEAAEQLAPRVDQLLDVAALGAVLCDDVIAMTTHSQYRYTNSFRLKSAWQNSASPGLLDERDRLLALERVGRPRQRQLERALDLLRRRRRPHPSSRARRRSSPASAPCRCSSGSAPAAQSSSGCGDRPELTRFG